VQETPVDMWLDGYRQRWPSSDDVNTIEVLRK
jgi:hypothetical protein